MRVAVAVVSIALLALAGCGFQPRGGLQVPPDVGPLRVQSSDPYNPVAIGLGRALARAGAAAGDRPARGVLRLASERWTEGPLVVDGTGRVREYVSRYEVEFDLRGADGRLVVPLQRIELSREYAYDATAAFGTAEEQSVIREELQRDMVAAILRRIEAALGAR